MWPAPALVSLTALLLVAAAAAGGNQNDISSNSEPAPLSAASGQYRGDADGLDQDQWAELEQIGRRQRRAAGAQEAITAGECQGLWAHLRSSYPALAGHLLARARQQTNERSQVSRSVARLLEEAERVISLASLAGAERRLTLNNPTYAKLVQQLHHIQRHQQQQSRHLARPAPATPAPVPAHEHGRLVHHPSELRQLGGSSTSRTINKLRQLNDAIARVSKDNEAIESNRIPSGADGWPQKQHSGPSASPPADGSSGKFVYGNVLFRPQHQQQPSPETSPNRRLMQGLRRHQAVEPANDTTRLPDESEVKLRPEPFPLSPLTSVSQEPAESNADELAKQLGASVAVAPADDSAAAAAAISNEPRVLASAGPGEEFEGDWLGQPVEVEVRPSRRDEASHGQVLIRLSTPGPPDVFVVD